MFEKILQLHGASAYALIFFLPALEASVFLGFVFPGEIAVLLGGVLAYQGKVSLGWAIGLAVAGAVIGDSAGYEVGRHFGPRLLDGPLKRFVKPDHRERATAFIRRNGGKAVFLGRFTAALRVLVPGFAGMAQMPYPTFLIYNLLGGALWATGVTLLGYAAGNGYRRVQHVLGRASLVLLGFVLVIGLVAWVARWVSRNPERVSAWWQRQRNRALYRRFGRQIDFVVARLNPGEVFGLRLTLGAIIAVALGTAFGVVLRGVAARQELIHIDKPILDALIRHAEGGLTATMKVVAALGGTLVVSVVAAPIVVALAARRRWPQAFLVVAAPLGALGLQHLVKELVRRPRPPVRALVHAGGYGFPSGHTAVAIAFYGALALLLARATKHWSLKVTAWTAALVLAGLIGFARMYLRVHYFTDVLGGFALGATWLAVVISAEGVWRRASAQRTRAAEAPAA